MDLNNSNQDPREFVPPTGQTWTTLGELGKQHKNVWEQDEKDSRVWSLWTEPKVLLNRHTLLTTGATIDMGWIEMLTACSSRLDNELFC